MFLTKRLVLTLLFLAVVLLFTLSLSILFFWNYLYQKPFIEQVSPQLFSQFPATVRVKGKNLQDPSQYTLYLGDLPLSSDNLLSWSTQEITFTLPYLLRSQFLSLRNAYQQSNAVLLILEKELPLPLGSPQDGVLLLQNLSPQGPYYLGQRVTLEGNYLNLLQSSGKIRLPSGPYEESYLGLQDSPTIALQSPFLETISENYLSFVLPSGLTSGNFWLEIEIGKASSNALFLELHLPAGSYVYTHPQQYSLQQEITLRNWQQEDSQLPSSLTVWLALPTEDTYQRNIEILTESQPALFPTSFARAYRWEITPNTASTPRKLEVRTTLLRYQKNTYITDPYAIPQYDKDLQFYQHYTREFSPEWDSAIPFSLYETLSPEGTVYHQVQALYEKLLEDFSLEESFKQDFLQMLETQKLNSYGFSLLLTKLLRKQGIPARSLAGVLFERNQSYPHFWNEVYFPAVGWFPIDLALAKRPLPLSTVIEDPRVFYFGNMDNKRIHLSKDFLENRVLSKESRLHGANGLPYTLQNFYEESTNLRSHASQWTFRMNADTHFEVE